MVKKDFKSFHMEMRPLMLLPAAPALQYENRLPQSSTIQVGKALAALAIAA
jgi:hypothetical protein